MTKALEQYSLEQWIELLTSQPLPVTTEIKQHVLSAIEEGHHAFTQLSRFVSKDPAISLHILSHANSHKPSEEIKSLPLSMSMLGEGRLKQLVEAIPVFDAEDNEQTSPRALPYLKAMNTSLHAAYQARSWSSPRHQVSSEDLYWSGLFFDAGLWALWWSAPKHMEKLSIEMRVGASMERVSESILGCKLHDLLTAFAEHMNLPRLSLRALNIIDKKPLVAIARRIDEYHHTPVLDLEHPRDKDLSFFLSEPALPIILANWLAKKCLDSWYCRTTLRIYKVLAVYQQTSTNAVIRQCHQTACQMSREKNVDIILPPAARLIFPVPDIQDPRKRYAITLLNDSDTEEKNTGIDSASSTAASAPAPLSPSKRHLDAKGLKSLCQTMVKSPEKTKDLNNLMQQTVRSCHQHIQLRRVIAALMSHDGSRLRGYFAAGQLTKEQVLRFQFDMNDPYLFQKVMKKPQTLWLKGNARGSLLPAHFKKAFATEHFFVASLFSDKRPIGLLFADINQDKDPLNEVEFKAFKYLAQACQLNLQFFSKHKSRSKT